MPPTVTTNDGNLPSPRNTFSHTTQIRQSSAAALAGWAAATAAGCAMTPPTPLTPRPARDPARHRRRERLTVLSAETDEPISVTPQYPTTTRDAPVRAAGQVPTRIVRRVVATPPRQIAQHLRRRAPRARLGRRALSILTDMTRICQTAEPCAPPRTLPARCECWFKSRHLTIEIFSVGAG